MGKAENFKQGLNSANERKGQSNKKAGAPIQECPLATLVVTVERAQDARVGNFKNAVLVKNTNTSKKIVKNAQCEEPCEFSSLEPGTYEISAKPAQGHGFSFEKSATVTLGQGDKQIAKVMLQSAEITAVSQQKDWKQYVNLSADKTQPSHGRLMETAAKLNKAIPGVNVYFLLKPDAKNAQNLPNALQATTKVVTGRTDSSGIAKVRLELSRFGGDKFQVLASLYAYPTHDSAHAVASKEITVWRKMWYQITADKGAVLPARKTNADAYIETALETIEVDNTLLEYKTIAGLTYHPLWQFSPHLRTSADGDRQVVCVGDHNKREFYKLYKAPVGTQPKAHLIMCDVQWDPSLGPVSHYSLEARESRFNQINAAGNDYLGVFNPPLNGGKLVHNAKWSWSDGKHTHNGQLDDAAIMIEKSRASYATFKVTLPSTCKAGECRGCGGGTTITPTPHAPANLRMQLNCGDGPWAGESGQPGRPQCLIVVNPDENTFNNTIAHEIGHLFSQVRKEKNWLGIPDHPDQYEKRGGQGSHCKKDATEDATYKDQDGNPIYDGGTCIMYHVAVGNTKFCENCQLDLKIRDLSDFFLKS